MLKTYNIYELMESWEQYQNYLLLVKTRAIIKRKTLTEGRDQC